MPLVSVGRTWLEGRDVIVKFLKDIRPDMTEAQHEHNAACLIARLAHNDPPLLICTLDEMKDE